MHADRPGPSNSPAPAPGKAAAEVRNGQLWLENNALCMAWRIEGGGARPVSLEDKISGSKVALERAECFTLIMAKTPFPGTRTLRASDLKVVGRRNSSSIQADEHALRLADRQPGRAIAVRLASADGDLAVTWQAVLRDGSNYIRQLISCQAKQKEVELTEIVVWDLGHSRGESPRRRRRLAGHGGQLFFAAEHPMSKAGIVDKAAEPGSPKFTCSYEVGKSLHPGEPLQFRSLVGVTPEGQMRRGFLYYLERERAQPYRQYLHYNNGSEIGMRILGPHKPFGKPGEAKAFRRRQQQDVAGAIDAFGRELVNTTPCCRGRFRPRLWMGR